MFCPYPITNEYRKDMLRKKNWISKRYSAKNSRMSFHLVPIIIRLVLCLLELEMLTQLWLAYFQAVNAQKRAENEQINWLNCSLGLIRTLWYAMALAELYICRSLVVCPTNILLADFPIFLPFDSWPQFCCMHEPFYFWTLERLEVNKASFILAAIDWRNRYVSPTNPALTKRKSYIGLVKSISIYRVSINVCFFWRPCD